jgi:hypothetical protein
VEWVEALELYVSVQRFDVLIAGASGRSGSTGTRS